MAMQASRQQATVQQVEEAEESFGPLPLRQLEVCVLALKCLLYISSPYLIWNKCTCWILFMILTIEVY